MAIKKGMLKTIWLWCLPGSPWACLRVMYRLFHRCPVGARRRSWLLSCSGLRICFLSWCVLCVVDINGGRFNFRLKNWEVIDVVVNLWGWLVKFGSVNLVVMELDPAITYM